jgi:hypothetical protein
MVQAITEAGEVNVCRIELRFQFVPDHPVGVETRLTQGIVGLVGNEDQGVAAGLQSLERRKNTVDEAKVLRGERRLHAPGERVEDGGIKNTVAVEKDGWPGHFIDSHFISLMRRRG